MLLVRPIKSCFDWFRPARLAAGAGLLAGLVAAVGAAEAPATADKSRYDVFHPTPDALLRELTADRPDKTESAYTVDAGRFQLEMDLASYTGDDGTIDGVRRRLDAFAVGTMNLKLGLTHRSDVQLVLEPYQHVYERGGGTRVTRQGFGDVTLRYKHNLWGNDIGATALALMPYLKLPTSQDDLGNDAVEGGLIVPLAASLPGGFGFGMMTQFDAARDGDDRGYHPEFVNSITVNRPLFGPVEGYVEFYSAVSTERGSDWVGTFDFGFAWTLAENLRLDAGLNLGVTEAADDWNPFVGLTWRF